MLKINKLVIASNNQGKLREFQTLLKPYINEVILPPFFEVEETGNTFEENSIIKAKYLYDLLKTPVLADDSGLEITALNNQPGVKSSRFANSFGSYKETFSYLEKELHSKDLSARFVCNLTLYVHPEEVYNFEGICSGVLTFPPRGLEGFSYDPIFTPLGTNKTFGEMTQEEKNTFSHRSNALKKLLEKLS